MQELITIAQAARMLGTSKSSLQKKCQEGSLISFRVGHTYRVRQSDVLALITPTAIKKESAPERNCPDDLRVHIDGWLSYLTHVKALSPNTIDLYQTLLRSYLKRMAAVGQPPLAVADLFDRKNVMTVFAKIPPKSFNTKNNTFIVLRSLGSYLLTEGRLDHATLDALRPLKPRRQSEPRRTALKPLDVPRIFDTILTCSNPPAENLTLAAMVAVMVYAGLRVSEVCGLRHQDVDLAARVLVVRHGKGGKDRRVGISSPLFSYLKPYEGVRPASARVYFTDRDGQPWDRTRLARRMRSISRLMGCDITCHGLRRTFATLAANHGRSVNAIRIALGHADLTTTQAYLRTSEAEVVEAMKGW